MQMRGLPTTEHMPADQRAKRRMPLRKDPAPSPSIPVEALGVKALADEAQSPPNRKADVKKPRPEPSRQTGVGNGSAAPTALKPIPKFHPSWEEGSRVDNDVESGYGMSPASNGGRRASPHRTAPARTQEAPSGSRRPPSAPRGSPGNDLDSISSVTGPSPTTPERKSVRKGTHGAGRDGPAAASNAGAAEAPEDYRQALSEDTSEISSRRSRRYERYKSRPAVYTVSVDAGADEPPSAL